MKNKNDKSLQSINDKATKLMSDVIENECAGVWGSVTNGKNRMVRKKLRKNSILWQFVENITTIHDLRFVYSEKHPIDKPSFAYLCESTQDGTFITIGQLHMMEYYKLNMTHRNTELENNP